MMPGVDGKVFIANEAGELIANEQRMSRISDITWLVIFFRLITMCFSFYTRNGFVVTLRC